MYASRLFTNLINLVYPTRQPYEDVWGFMFLKVGKNKGKKLYANY